MDELVVIHQGSHNEAERAHGIAPDPPLSCHHESGRHASQLLAAFALTVTVTVSQYTLSSQAFVTSQAAIPTIPTSPTVT